MQIFRRSLLVAAAFGIMAAADGQAQTIGFKLGPSFSTISTDEPDISFSTLTKFTGGGFMRFGMGGLAIQPELMYVTKGGKMSETFEGETFDAELRLDYIEIPVLLVLPIGPGIGIAPYVYAGPAFAFEAGCTVAFSTAGFDGSVDCDEGDNEPGELSTDRRKFDIGAMVGGGLSFPMGPGALLVEGRYNFGLMNLNTSTEGNSVKNRSGAALVGYSIPIGR
ncbi:porin family protein [soil metagenome]